MRLMFWLAIPSIVLLAVAGGQSAAEPHEKVVVLETSQGNIVIELFSGDASNHVDNFIDLAGSGFYNGTVFHRVINNFLIQGGDPNTISGDPSIWGTGGADKKISGEFNDIKHNRGIVSMTRTADPDGASTQFFIVHKESNFLNGQYTVFGRLATEGSYQTLDSIAATPIGARAIPLDPDQARIIGASAVDRSEIQDLLDQPEPSRLPADPARSSYGQPLPDSAVSALFPELGVRVEIVAENLVVPWSIDWTPDGTILVTERGGNLRAIQDGELLPEPLLSVSANTIEGGLLGLAVDPDFEDNNYIYLYFTYDDSTTSNANKAIRYQFVDGMVTEDRVLIDGVPGGAFHDGGRMQFGPDGKLYIATGDGGEPEQAQDPDSLAGKILRINSDGSIPEDNPFVGSPIWSTGHRNPQGMDWDEAGNLLVTEHGPSGWRGVAHDEVNLIVPGANYGWPVIIGDETAEGMQKAILNTGNETWAPSGAEFYDGDKIPEWAGKYFVATLRGNHLHIVDFDLQNEEVISHGRLFQGEFGRLRDVQTGPDGFLYLLTSNRDGRGPAIPTDDRIIRIAPLVGDLSGSTMPSMLEVEMPDGVIKVGDTESAVRYEITGSELLSVMPSTESNSLVARIGAGDGGSLTLAIPRTVADSKTEIEVDDYRVPEGMLQFGRIGSEVQDNAFIVLVDGKEADFDETVSATTRLLTVEFPAGAEEIEVIGTFVVPEFGAITVMVLVAAMGLLVVASTGSRYGTVFSR